MRRGLRCLSFARDNIVSEIGNPGSRRRIGNRSHSRRIELSDDEQAKASKQHLSAQKAERTKEPPSKTTIYSPLAALKAFFVWLADKPGYKSRISYADTEYLNMTMKDARIAKAVREPRVPTMEQIPMCCVRCRPPQRSNGGIGRCHPDRGAGRRDRLVQAQAPRPRSQSAGTKRAGGPDQGVKIIPYVLLPGGNRRPGDHRRMG
jgi:hypothetical protein